MTSAIAPRFLLQHILATRCKTQVSKGFIRSDLATTRRILKGICWPACTPYTSVTTPATTALRCIRTNTTPWYREVDPWDIDETVMPPYFRFEDEDTHSHVVVEQHMVPMRDGVRLASTVYRPSFGGGIPVPEALPVVFHRTPYNKDKSARTERCLLPDGTLSEPIENPLTAERFARRGYVVVMQDCRGRYQSEGRFTKYVNEGKDGEDSLAWIVAQPWCNGKIGTFGLSYCAHVQLALSCKDPVGLAAMFLESGGFYDAYKDGVRYGGAFTMKQVTWAVKNAKVSPEVTSSPEIKSAMESMDIHDWFRRVHEWLPGYSPMSLAPDYEAYIFHDWQSQYHTEDWERIGLSVAAHLNDMADVPTLIICSWYDPYIGAMTDLFNGLKSSKRSVVRMVLGPWTHGDHALTYAGEVDFGPQCTFDRNVAPTFQAARAAWFDEFLHGRPPGASPTPGASPVPGGSPLGGSPILGGSPVSGASPVVGNSPRFSGIIPPGQSQSIQRSSSVNSSASTSVDTLPSSKALSQPIAASSLTQAIARSASKGSITHVGGLSGESSASEVSRTSAVCTEEPFHNISSEHLLFSSPGTDMGQITPSSATNFHVLHSDDVVAHAPDTQNVHGTTPPSQAVTRQQPNSASNILCPAPAAAGYTATRQRSARTSMETQVASNLAFFRPSLESPSVIMGIPWGKAQSAAAAAAAANRRLSCDQSGGVASRGTWNNGLRQSFDEIDRSADVLLGSMNGVNDITGHRMNNLAQQRPRQASGVDVWASSSLFHSETGEGKPYLDRVTPQRADACSIEAGHNNTARILPPIANGNAYLRSSIDSQRHSPSAWDSVHPFGISPVSHYDVHAAFRGKRESGSNNPDRPSSLFGGKNGAPTPFAAMATLPSDLFETSSVATSSAPWRQPQPPVKYFRMGGGPGTRSAEGRLQHGGVWLSCKRWPPAWAQRPVTCKLLQGGLMQLDEDDCGNEVPDVGGGLETLLEGQGREECDTGSDIASTASIPLPHSPTTHKQHSGLHRSRSSRLSGDCNQSSTTHHNTYTVRRESRTSLGAISQTYSVVTSQSTQTSQGGALPVQRSTSGTTTPRKTMSHGNLARLVASRLLSASKRPLLRSSVDLLTAHDLEDGINRSISAISPDAPSETHAHSHVHSTSDPTAIAANLSAALQDGVPTPRAISATLMTSASMASLPDHASIYGASESGLDDGGEYVDVPCIVLQHDPMNPVPTIGGNITSGEPIMSGGAFDQMEKARFFGCSPNTYGRKLCDHPGVISWSTAPLETDLELTGTVKVVLAVSSDAPDADFHVTLVDEYPPSEDYPHGFSLNASSGIARAKVRHGCKPDQVTWLQPEEVQRIMVELNVTSNLFLKGHKLRLDISASSYPRYDINYGVTDKEHNDWLRSQGLDHLISQHADVVPDPCDTTGYVAVQNAPLSEEAKHAMLQLRQRHSTSQHAQHLNGGEGTPGVLGRPYRVATHVIYLGGDPEVSSYVELPVRRVDWDPEAFEGKGAGHGGRLIPFSPKWLQRKPTWSR